MQNARRAQRRADQHKAKETDPRYEYVRFSQWKFDAMDETCGVDLGQRVEENRGLASAARGRRLLIALSTPRREQMPAMDICLCPTNRAWRELARVCKKGGRLGICRWPPEDTERCGGSTVSSLICGEVGAMLQAWLSIGYIVLLAILVLAFILWRRGGPVLAIAALVVGIPLWFGWEYARPTWTTGVITGTEVRRSDPDARGNTTDIEYIYMRNPSDRGLELINDNSWWWLKRNSERVFNDAKTAQSRNTEVTLMWNRWRSTLFSWYPNVIAIGPAGSWPLWSVRTIIFYGLSVVLWLSYFYAFFRLRRSSAAVRDRNPDRG